ncbi:MAG: hypothetical protein RIT32_826 [Actinomycetota bacterium]|jgi:uncharacterized protein YdhG (YjbR/CyaY superfamily)
MSSYTGDRAKAFPAIEKKYGKPMSYWFTQLKEVADEKYPEQISFLRERFGFSQAHANAVVMYSRGSKSAKRFSSPTDYINKLDPISKKTVKAIFKTIQTKYPKLELVVAWNQPMLKVASGYVFGLGVQKNHILINPFSKDVIDQNIGKWDGYKVSKHTIQIPKDWQIDSKILLALIKDRLTELK